MIWANMKLRAPYSTSKQLRLATCAFAEHFCFSTAMRTHSAEIDQVRVNILVPIVYAFLLQYNNQTTRLQGDASVSFQSICGFLLSLTHML